MTNSLHAASLTVFAALFFAGCASDPPTCSATDMSYTICAEEQVWECPIASPEQQAKKKAITDACGNDTQCVLHAKYEMYPMTLKAKCGEGGEVCVQSTGPSQSASCQKK